MNTELDARSSEVANLLQYSENLYAYLSLNKIYQIVQSCHSQVKTSGTYTVFQVHAKHL